MYLLFLPLTFILGILTVKQSVKQALKCSPLHCFLVFFSLINLIPSIALLVIRVLPSAVDLLPDSGINYNFFLNLLAPDVYTNYSLRLFFLAVLSTLICILFQKPRFRPSKVEIVRRASRILVWFAMPLTLLPVAVVVFILSTSIDFTSLFGMRIAFGNFFNLSEISSLVTLPLRLSIVLSPIFSALFLVRGPFKKKYNKLVSIVFFLSALVTLKKSPIGIIFLLLVCLSASKRTHISLSASIRKRSIFPTALLAGISLIIFWSMSSSYETDDLYTLLLSWSLRLFLTPHLSSLSKDYFMQSQGLSQFDENGSRISALFHGISYDPSTLIATVTQHQFGFPFGDTSSFITLSFIRGGYPLFFTEALLTFAVPLVLYLLWLRVAKDSFLSGFLACVSIYYVIIVSSVDLSSALSYYLFGYIALLSLSSLMFLRLNF